MATRSVRRRLWLVYGAVGITVMAVALPLPGLPHAIVYNLTGLSAVVAILLGVRLHHPPRRGMWYLLAGGLAVFVAGDVVYSVYAYVLFREPFPSPADGLYLASYPLLAAGMLVMIRSRTRGRDRAGLIDALMVATGLGLLSWTFLMKPIADDPSLTLGSRLISLAYPLADVLLLVVLARLVTGPGARTTAYWLLAAAVLLQLGADVVYAVLTTVASYSGGLVDAGWMLAYLCFGAAASWTWTTSSGSTTPTAIRPATCCSRPPPRAGSRSCVRGTCSPGTGGGVRRAPERLLPGRGRRDPRPGTRGHTAWCDRLGRCRPVGRPGDP
jgi:diguanylate cyclase